LLADRAHDEPQNDPAEKAHGDLLARAPPVRRSPVSQTPLGRPRSSSREPRTAEGRPLRGGTGLRDDSRERYESDVVVELELGPHRWSALVPECPGALTWDNASASVGHR